MTEAPAATPFMSAHLQTPAATTNTTTTTTSTSTTTATPYRILFAEKINFIKVDSVMKELNLTGSFDKWRTLIKEELEKSGALHMLQQQAQQVLDTSKVLEAETTYIKENPGAVLKRKPVVQGIKRELVESDAMKHVQQAITALLQPKMTVYDAVQRGVESCYDQLLNHFEDTESCKEQQKREQEMAEKRRREEEEEQHQQLLLRQEQELQAKQAREQREKEREQREREQREQREQREAQKKQKAAAAAATRKDIPIPKHSKAKGNNSKPAGIDLIKKLEKRLEQREVRMNAAAAAATNTTTTTNANIPKDKLGLDDELNNSAPRYFAKRKLPSDDQIVHKTPSGKGVALVSQQVNTPAETVSQRKAIFVELFGDDISDDDEAKNNTTTSTSRLLSTAPPPAKRQRLIVDDDDIDEAMPAAPAPTTTTEQQQQYE